MQYEGLHFWSAAQVYTDYTQSNAVRTQMGNWVRDFNFALHLNKLCSNATTSVRKIGVCEHWSLCFHQISVCGVSDLYNGCQCNQLTSCENIRKTSCHKNILQAALNYEPILQYFFVFVKCHSIAPPIRERQDRQKIRDSSFLPPRLLQ